MKQFNACLLFISLFLFAACSNNIQISEQLQKTINKNRIEKVQINLNGQSFAHKIEEVKVGELFITVGETDYNIGAVKAISVNNKELNITM